MRDLVRRRANSEPVAYLVGHREFFSLDFVVNRHVLIPRPDTEILVMAAMDVARELPSAKILELCTGSGCVAVALAKNVRTATIQAVEICPNAAEVARENIRRHKVEDKVRLLVGDLFQPVENQERFDLIVSNPPYVTDGEIATLPPDVRDHEPHLALAAGEDGFDVIRKLADQAPAHATAEGWLMFELADEQAEPAAELLKSKGYREVEIKRDLGGLARVVIGQVPAS